MNAIATSGGEGWRYCPSHPKLCSKRRIGRSS